jgi:sugar/nucleoside kinase (ribokinase family)
MNPKIECIIIGAVFLDLGLKANYISIAKGGILYCDRLHYTFGGSGNISVALSSLGVSSYFVGKAGGDQYGNLYKENLEKENVRTKIFYDNYLPTGILISLIDDDADRSFLVARGANDSLTIGEVKEAIENIEFGFLYITGYSLINSPQKDALLYAARIGREKGAKVFFDAGAFNIIDPNRNYFDKVLKLSDIISANVHEAKILSQTRDANKAVATLSQNASLVILRQGKEGCIIFSNENNKIKVPASQVSSIDTTGAGDAFNAAFISSMIRKWSLKDAAYFANWFASKTTEKLGARSFPSKSEINKFIESFKRD